MVSRDKMVLVDSTDMIKGYISDWLNYRQPYKRINNEKLSKVLAIDPNTHQSKLPRALFFGRNATDHLSTMSGTFFEFDIDIVGHLESFQLDWENKVLTTYPALNGFKFDHARGNHKTSVNHPNNGSKEQKKKDKDH